MDWDFGNPIESLVIKSGLFPFQVLDFKHPFSQGEWEWSLSEELERGSPIFSDLKFVQKGDFPIFFAEGGVLRSPSPKSCGI